MSIAGGFIAIVTNHAFALLNSKLIFTYMALPRNIIIHIYKNITVLMDGKSPACQYHPITGQFVHKRQIKKQSSTKSNVV